MAYLRCHGVHYNVTCVYSDDLVLFAYAHAVEDLNLRVIRKSVQTKGLNCSGDTYVYQCFGFTNNENFTHQFTIVWNIYGLPGRDGPIALTIDNRSLINSEVDITDGLTLRVITFVRDPGNNVPSFSESHIKLEILHNVSINGLIEFECGIPGFLYRRLTNQIFTTGKSSHYNTWN